MVRMSKTEHSIISSHLCSLLRASYILMSNGALGVGLSNQCQFVENVSALVTLDEKAISDLFAVLKTLIAHNIFSLQPSSPLYVVGESNGASLPPNSALL